MVGAFERGNEVSLGLPCLRHDCGEERVRRAAPDDGRSAQDL
jgi:hypothetical protein